MCKVYSLGVLPFVLLVVASPASAWWFFDSSGRQEADGPIEESCIAKARKGDCNFYTCYEQRFPCESNNFALDYGFRFCTRFNNHYAQLTPAARRWLNATRVCTMGKMVEFYSRDDNNCNDVEEEMKDASTHCEVEHGVCSIDMLDENKDVLSTIFDSNPQTAERFLRLIQHCGFERARGIGEWMSAHTRPIYEFIGDAKGTLDGIIGNIQREFERDVE